jgi:amidase
MARHVEDLVVAMGGLVGPDGRDASVPDIPFGDPSMVALGNLRVAFYTDNGFVRTQACVSRVIYAAAEALTRDLHVVKEDRPRVLELAFDLEMKLLGADGGDSIWKYLEEVGSQNVHPLLRRWLERLDAYRTDIGGFQAYWSEWDLYQTEMLAFLSNYDVILCPAYTQAALPHGTSQSDENFHGFSHTMAYNLAGWPAAVVRCGESPEGLPIGIQVVARPWREDVALAVAGWLEKEFGGWREPPVSRSRDQA